jgi:hypothetical protein
MARSQLLRRVPKRDKIFTVVTYGCNLGPYLNMLDATFVTITALFVSYDCKLIIKWLPVAHFINLFLLRLLWSENKLQCLSLVITLAKSNICEHG